MYLPYTPGMPRVLLFNKPYCVLCQFRPVDGRRTLRDFIAARDVHAAGRLDADSEGLLVLTADGAAQHAISHPANKLPKHYFAQVEGSPTDDNLIPLRQGAIMRDYRALPVEVHIVNPPEWLWPRVPPIRERRNIPTTWLHLVLREGRNRQVRHMTAGIGFPTLRLIRYQIGDWTLKNLQQGECRWADYRLPNVPRKSSQSRISDKFGSVHPNRHRK